MSLYKQWTDMVVEYVKTKGEAAFWNEYTKIETSIYRDLLANSKETIKTTISDFAKKYEIFIYVTTMGCNILTRKEKRNPKGIQRIL